MHRPPGATSAGNWRDDAFWIRSLSDGLTVAATTRPDSPVVERFFAGYDRAFVLPDEREELEGFRACLALNETCRNSFARTHCELVLTISGSEGLLAGANFLATALAAPPRTPPVAVALNYIFVEPAARRLGLLRRALGVVRALALEAVEAGQRDVLPAVFIEQNDPVRMTEEAYRNDTVHSGLDQIERLAIWARVGARIVDFPYVQPALSAGQQADDGLVYAAVDYPGEAVPARLLHQHLESFFGISVLKGRSPASDPVAAAQLDALAGRSEPLALLPVERALEQLRADPAAARRHHALRSLAEEAGR